MNGLFKDKTGFPDGFFNQCVCVCVRVFFFFIFALESFLMDNKTIAGWSSSDKRRNKWINGMNEHLNAWSVHELKSDVVCCVCFFRLYYKVATPLLLHMVGLKRVEWELRTELNWTLLKVMLFEHIFDVSNMFLVNDSNEWILEMTSPFNVQLSVLSALSVSPFYILWTSILVTWCNM